MTEISVVIPTCNGAPFIRDALESVFAQTLPPREILVVDDASTDGTVKIVESLARRAPVPVSVIRLESNSGGPTWPLNIGIQAARGAFVALLDQDDRMTETKVETVAALANRFPASGLVFGRCQWMDHEGKIEPLINGRYDCYPDGPAEIGPGEALGLFSRVGYRYGGAGGTAVNRRAWRAVGGFRERFTIVWDFDFALRLALHGWPVAYSPTTFFFHRVHDHNLQCLGNGFRWHREEIAMLKLALSEAGCSRVVRKLIARMLARRLLDHGYRERMAGALAASLSHYLRAALWDPCLGTVVKASVAAAKLPVAAVRDSWIAGGGRHAARGSRHSGL